MSFFPHIPNTLNIILHAGILQKIAIVGPTILSQFSCKVLLQFSRKLSFISIVVCPIICSIAKACMRLVQGKIWRLQGCILKGFNSCLCFVFVLKVGRMQTLHALVFGLIYVHNYITGVSYKRFPSVAGLPNLYSVIDGKCTLKVENNCYTENTFYMKQAVHTIHVYYICTISSVLCHCPE